MQNDKAYGSTASGLLRNTFPSLTGLGKTFQLGSLNFLRVLSAINKCKLKIFEVAKDDRIIQQLK